METLQDRFCRKFACKPEEFERRAFALSLYPHAKIFAFLGKSPGSAFSIDRSLVRYCGRLTTLGEIDAELREYAGIAENRQFLRRTLRIRLSGRRFRRLAESCLKQG